MSKRSRNFKGDSFPKKDRPDARGVMGRREREVDDTIAKLGRCNDPAWYRQYPSVVETSAHVPFANPAGRATSISLNNGEYTYTAPGIMTFEWWPTYGYSADKRSPLNIAFLRLYERMRSELQGSISSLEYADIAMYCLAVDSLYCLHRYARMIYGLINAYSVQNWYFPRGMVQALGFDIDDLVGSGPNFRYYLDQMAIMLGHLYLPGGSEELTIFKRHAWLSENYFLDSGNARAQVYLPKLVALYKYSNTGATGSALIWTHINSVPETNQAKYLYDTFMSFYNALAGDEDTGNISGFMARVFGNQMEAALTPDNFMVTPTFSDEVLSQIENMRFIYPNEELYRSWNITQDPSVNGGAIICTPKVQDSIADASFSGDVLLNFHKMNPSPDDVMVATRLASVFERRDDATYVIGFGTEFVSAIMYWTFKSDGTLQSFPWLRSNVIVDTTNVAALNELLSEALLHSQFDWAPIHVVMGQAGAGGTVSLIGIMADLDVYTTIPKDLLCQLHNVAIQSELYVKLR